MEETAKKQTYYERNKEKCKAYQRTYYAGLTLEQRAKRSKQSSRWWNRYGKNK